MRWLWRKLRNAFAKQRKPVNRQEALKRLLSLTRKAQEQLKLDPNVCDRESLPAHLRRLIASMAGVVTESHNVITLIQKLGSTEQLNIVFENLKAGERNQPQDAVGWLLEFQHHHGRFGEPLEIIEVITAFKAAIGFPIFVEILEAYLDIAKSAPQSPANK